MSRVEVEIDPGEPDEGRVHNAVVHKLCLASGKPVKLENMSWGCYKISAEFSLLKEAQRAARELGNSFPDRIIVVIS